MHGQQNIKNYQFTFGFTRNGHLIFHCTSLTDTKHLQSDVIKLS